VWYHCVFYVIMIDSVERYGCFRCVAMNGHLTYSIPDGVAGNNFRVNSTTGVVTTTLPLDREARDSWIITGWF
jgi:hypothetical protein